MQLINQLKKNNSVETFYKFCKYRLIVHEVRVAESAKQKKNTDNGDQNVNNQVHAKSSSNKK